jgi:uncharacterized membrane protein YgaE (UPF0421/DUF939 family)
MIGSDRERRLARDALATAGGVLAAAAIYAVLSRLIEGHWHFLTGLLIAFVVLVAARLFDF